VIYWIFYTIDMLLHFQQRFIEFYAMLLLHVIWCTLVDKIIIIFCGEFSGLGAWEKSP